MSGFPITYAIEPQCLSFADLTVNTIYLIQDGKKTKNRAKLLGKDSNSQQVHIKWIDAGWEKWYEFEIGKIELDVLNNSLHSYAPRSCNTHSTKKLHETEVKVKSEPIDDEERDSDEEKVLDDNDKEKDSDEKREARKKKKKKKRKREPREASPSPSPPPPPPPFPLTLTPTPPIK